MTPSPTNQIEAAPADCLPTAIAAQLGSTLERLGANADSARLSPLHSGRSGALTYLVTASDQKFVLRIQPPDRLTSHWENLVTVQRQVARAGLTPRLRHVDVPARWLLADHVDDASLLGALRDPTRSAITLASLGEQLAQLHGTAPPRGTQTRSPTDHSSELLEETKTRFALPELAVAISDDVRRRASKSSEARLCHHDLNPTNILYDGQQIWFVDWETAGIGDPWFDVATLINWLLLDQSRRETLLRAYCGGRQIDFPSEERLNDARRVAYFAYGSTFLSMCTAPPTGGAPSALGLAECHLAIGRGELDIGSDSGRWLLAMALFREYLALN